MSFLSRLFSRKSYSPWDEVKERIIPAFIHEGVQYYQFEDTFNMCSGRAFAALDIYQEHKMSTSREFLELHSDVVGQKIAKCKEALTVTDNVLDLNKVYDPLKELEILNNQIKDRLKHIVGYETSLKLASVIYFTKDEKPYKYDFKYNIETKIPAFKRMDKDFFLLMRTADLMPSGDMSEEDLKTYATTQDKVNKHMLENLLSQSSEDFKKTEAYKNLNLWKSTDYQEMTSE